MAIVSMLTPGLSLCAVLAPATFAQSEAPPPTSITSWTTEAGLPQNSVSSLSQDSAGYLWISTYGGLARFDGRRFEVFDVGNRPDLPGNRFNLVVAGRDDVLWVLIQDVGLLRYRDDEFTRIPGSGAVQYFAEDANGRVWTMTERDVGRVVEDRVVPLRQGVFRTILPTRDGAVWLPTLQGALVRILDDQVSELGTEAGLPGTSFPALVQDGEGRVWAGSKWGTWRSTDSTNTRFVRVESGPDLVQAMARDEQGALWFGGGGRLVRWDPELDSFSEVAQGNFTSLLADRRGNLWAGSTTGEGLRCIRKSPLRDVTAAAGLPSGDTWAITEGRSGSVLIVMTRLLLEVGGDRVAQHEFESNTRSALVDGHGDLWVGQSRGVLRIRGEERTEYADDPALLGGVRALFESRDGTLWIGTTSGLSYREGDRFTAVPADDLVNIRCILEDETTGRLWVGTQQGLARIDGESVTWLTSQDGLSPGSVRTLHMDAEGILWVGTYGGGLSRIEGETITRYTRENGLADNFLACILADDRDRLWINSNRGPFVVRREDLNRVARGESRRVACVLFTRAEGAREANGGNQPSGWRAPDGRMWFPSIEGVTVADPGELPVVEDPPRVLIEALEVGDERELYTRFTALGFSAPERVRIQYRLVGHEPDWIESVGPREARYTYLQPGEYELEVRAKNGFGAWSEVAGRRFEIAAKLHETPAFLVGVVLLIGFGAFGFAELRIRAAHERAERLERLHAERERAERALSHSQAVLSRLSRGLLVTQESERRRISGELHDDVTQRIAALAIQAEIVEARLDSGSEHTRAQLRGIVEMAQELAGDVQQLSRRLHPVGLRTLGLSEAIRQECAAFTRRSDVRVEVTEDIASDEVPEDVAVAAFRILQESLHNIEKHARASEVNVGVEIEAGEFVLCVRDSGRGFDSERGADAGLGLITMQERAAAIGGRLSVVSRPGEGTVVCLHAPGPGSPQ